MAGEPTGRDELGRKAGDLLDREAGRLAARPKRTVARYLGYLALFIVCCSVFFGAVGFLAGWFGAGKDIVSPSNVRAQYGAVIDDYEGMKAAAGNYCQAKAAKADPNSPTLLEDPGFAYAANYRKTAVDYNRRQNNIFEAKAVGPKGYPRYAPSLKEMQAKVC